MNVVKGSFAPIVTPMSASGAIDYDALARMVEMHLAAGTAGLVVAGSTGEASMITAQEHGELIAQSVKLCNGKIPVVAGMGADATHKAIELAKIVRDAGASSGLAVVPYYVRPNQDGIMRHFEAIAEATDLPQIIYDVPTRSAVHLNDATLLALAKDPRIMGLKDCTGDMGRASRLFALLPDSFAFYSGDDATALAYMLLGGHGAMSVSANIVPQALCRLCELAFDGDVENARKLNTRLLPLYEALFIDTNPTPVKYMLAKLGQISERIRLPMLPLPPEKAPRIDAVLNDLARWSEVGQWIDPEHT